MNIKEEYPEIPVFLFYAMIGVVGSTKMFEILECYKEAKEEYKMIKGEKNDLDNSQIQV